MEYLRYIFRFFYRIRWWLICLPIIAGIIAYFVAQRQDSEYDVETTVYTGIISGYNIETNSNIAVSQPANSMDNLMNIITSESTLKKVSIRLYAQCMIHGNTEEDNNYIQAKNYRALLDITPKEVQALIDKKDEEATIKRLLDYERPNRKNFIYGLFNFYHPYFSISTLAKKIKVTRLGASDIIEIKYSASDPGVAYNTLTILNKEFIQQYQDLRFGEIDNVIKFFEAELARIGGELRIAEDSLTAYNIEKRIINYLEQTKQVTIIDADYQMKMQQLNLDYSSTKALADFLENKLGNQAKLLRSNSSFISQLNKISELNNKIANAQLRDDDGASKQINQYKKQLQSVEKGFASLSGDLTARKNSTENLESTTLIDQWLYQVMLAEKTKAELDAMENLRRKLDDDFVYYSPVGSTLKRKERNIGFTENTYMAMLNSLNAARLRQKNLQMTTATLKIMTPPAFPLNALPNKAKLIALIVFIVSIIFITGYFLLLEIIDRTLRDKLRTEHITKGKVLGVFPGENGLRYRRYNKTCNDMGTQFLSNTLLPYCKDGKQNIINLLSTESGDGKSFISESLIEYWQSIGIKVKRITYGIDFQPDDRKYLLADNIKDLCKDIDKEDILLVEHPPLHKYSVSPALLKEATMNLMIARANRTWKSTDQMIYDKMATTIGKDAPLFIYLNKADRVAVEDFIGQLPPYTKFKNLMYRLSQFGLTAE